jgi:hypothetical protein
MRGEGTCALISRSTAEFRAWRSCTVLFHHGDAEKNQIRGEARNCRSFCSESSGAMAQTAAELRSAWTAGADVPTQPWTGEGARPHTIRASHNAGGLLLQLLRLIVRGQRFDNRL